MPEGQDRRPDTVDPGTLLATTHPLETGGRVRLRLTRPSDVGLVEGFLGRLSERTRRRRFGTPEPDAGLVRHFTFYDPRRRLVVAAAMPDGGYERIVGLGDVALLATGLAEVGLVVGDGVQGQGIGTVLGEALAALAAQRGATHMKAALPGPNPPMERVMRRLGPVARAVEDGVPVVYARLDALRVRAA